MQSERLGFLEKLELLERGPETPKTGWALGSGSIIGTLTAATMGPGSVYRLEAQQVTL